MHDGTKAGTGMTPETARKFQPGDSARHIAWPETVRTRELMVRPFRIEFDARVQVICDLTSDIVWGGAEARELKSDLACYATEALTQLLLWQGDAVGHTLAAETLKVIQQGRGDVIYQTLRRTIDTAQPGSSERFATALEKTAATPRSKELIIAISDFLSDGWQRPLLSLAHYHDVIAVQVQDPWDLELPNLGTLVMAGDDSKTYRVRSGSSRVRETYHAEASELQQAIQSTMRRGDIRHLVLDTSKSLLSQLIRGIDRSKH